MPISQVKFETTMYTKVCKWDVLTVAFGMSPGSTAIYIHHT